MDEQNLEEISQETQSLTEETDPVSTETTEVAEQTAVPDKKKKWLRRGIYYALLAIFIAVFLYCAHYLLNYAVGSGKNDKSYGSLSDMVNDLRDHNASDDISGGTLPDSTLPEGIGGGEDVDPSYILPEYQEIYALNHDLVGWIHFDDLEIDYPVMQSTKNQNYYLNHDFYKANSNWGCIYVREACNVFRPSDNVVIYGHHMKDGSMFAALDGYKDAAFWKEHQYFTFDTLYEHHTYQIISVFKTSANVGEGFAYHLFDDAGSEEEFNEFMDQVHELEMYDTGVTAEYGDKLVTLSTCEYTLNNGRFVVIAKRIS